MSAVGVTHYVYNYLFAGEGSISGFSGELWKGEGKCAYSVNTDGRRILKDNRKQQPPCFRFMSWLSYGLVRLMMAMAGYACENIRAGNDRTPAPEG